MGKDEDKDIDEYDVEDQDKNPGVNGYNCRDKHEDVHAGVDGYGKAKDKDTQQATRPTTRMRMQARKRLLP